MTIPDLKYLASRVPRIGMVEAASSCTSGKRCGETNGRRSRAVWVDCSSNQYTPLEWSWAPTVVYQFPGKAHRLRTGLENPPHYGLFLPWGSAEAVRARHVPWHNQIGVRYPGGIWKSTTHAYTRLTALYLGLPGLAGARKVKPIWILLKQETMSGSGISWAICKSAPRSKQITTPAPHHSVFYRPYALSATQPTASKHKCRLRSLESIGDSSIR